MKAQASSYLALSLCLAASLLSACGPTDKQPAARNLVLISVDTLRADRLGCYGYDRDTSPNLDRFALGGVRFAQATVPSPWTLPSHASMFSGLTPKRHGATGLKSSMRKEATTLAERLAREGFQTHALVSSTILKQGGLERGFDSLELVDTGGPHPSAVTQASIAKLKEIQAAGRFFLLAHYIDPHTDYGSLEPFRSRFIEPYEGRATGVGAQLYRALSGEIELTAEDVRHLSNLYDGGVAQVDAQIEELLAYIKQSSLWEQTLVLITSDHGEEFLDHGGLMHGLNQYEEMVRVPLLLAGPGIPKGITSSAPVSVMDIVPTLLVELGIEAQTTFDGIALQSHWAAPGIEQAERHFYYEADWDAPQPGRQTLSKGWDRALRMGRYKLHLNLKSEAVSLFDLELDPGETQDLALQEPRICAALTKQLLSYLADDGHAAQDGDEAALTGAELEELIRLGYAGQAQEEDE